MKGLRLLSIAFLILNVFLGCEVANAQKGKSVFGGKVGYTTKNSSMTAGLFYQYEINQNLRLSPEVGCVFRNQDLDAFTVDLNVHFPMFISSEKLSLYPLAGLDLSAWSRHDNSILEGKDVTTRQTRLGLNAGAGFEYFVSPSMKLNIECKYTITSKYSTMVASFGVGYIF